MAAVEQQDPGVLRLDVVELAAQGPGGQLADLPGQLHPGRAPADQGEGEPVLLLGRVGAVSAISNAPNTRRRIVSASAIVFMPGASGANSSWPK